MTGCAIFGKQEPETITEYVDVVRPVSNVPMPPNTDCPQPEVEKTSTNASDGEVAKAYRIAVEQLRDCSALREKVINKYREIAKEDAERIEDFNKNNREDGPFSTSGPRNPMSAPVDDLENIRRQMTIERDFEELEEDFESLSEKEYDIE
jgi:hypothetical protein